MFYVLAPMNGLYGVFSAPKAGVFPLDWIVAGPYSNSGQAQAVVEALYDEASAEKDGQKWLESFEEPECGCQYPGWPRCRDHARMGDPL